MESAMNERERASVVVAAVFAGLASVADAQPVAINSGDRPSLAPLLKEVTPAVVNISVMSQRPSPQNPLLNDPFFRRFFELPEGEQPESVPSQSVGSGVIVDAERGYVLTNHHVIADAEEIIVTLTDRRRLTAKLIGSDPGTDVALLDIDADNLHQVPLGNSKEVQVGDFVVAIGNPFGLGQTVTSGIVSALGRSGINVEGYEDFIQTDASINPGNSGGALIDLAGELIGISTAILTPGGGNVGIGFAVPADMAKQVMNQVLEYGEVRRGRLGVYIQSLTPDLADALSIDVTEGAVVTQVEPGSAAERADLKAGDVIVAFNGEPVTGAADLRNKTGLSRVGTTATLTVLSDGRRREARVPIEESASAAAGGGGAATIERLLGVEFRNLDAQHPLYGRVEGVLVAGVATGSPAERSGLRAGDIVGAVNRTPVSSVQELSAALAAATSAIALNVRRGDSQLFIVVR
jgi:serine protease DegQ